jgi:transcriptional regulator with XRE-family HTH domain
MPVANRGRKPGEQTIVRTKLAAWRVRRGLTQEELAELAGISRSKLIRLERNVARTDMRVEDLAQLATALGCDPTDLLEHDWMRWRHKSVRQEDLIGHWRDGTLPSRAPSKTQAERELQRLLKALPDKIERPDAPVLKPATARPPQLRGAAHEAEVTAILTMDAAESAEHRRRAEALRRVATLREITG